MEYPEHSLIIAFIKGDLDDTQQTEIKRWIEAKSEHQQHFERIQDIWNEHGNKAERYQPKMDAAWLRIESSIESKTPVWQWVYRVAAVLVLVVGVTFFLIDRQGNSLSKVALTEHHASDAPKDINLPDGSVITLNTGSSVFFSPSFDQKIRHIQLKGEAFFDVARDENRPFIIETTYSKTEVLGTSFGITEKEKVTILHVVSGKVAFSSDKEQILLTKGDQGTLTASGQLTKTTNADRNLLYWKTGQLFFENAPLENVLRELEQHYHIKFQYEKSEATLSAQFNNQPLEEVLNILGSTLELEFTAIDSTTYIVK